MKRYVIYIVFILFLLGCKKKIGHSIKDYPTNILYEQKQQYDNFKWSYYAFLDSSKTDIKTVMAKDSSYKQYKTLVKDTLCISLEVKGKFFIDNKENTVSFYFRNNLYEAENLYCECDNLFIPDTFELRNDTLQKVYFGTIVVKRENFKPDTEFKFLKDKISNFPNTIRKYKDQLNPWLKAEAQRRGIID